MHCTSPSPLLIRAAGLLAGYGGYFGAGQGVILIVLLAPSGLDEDLQVVNAVKNGAVKASNAAAAVVFAAFADLDWAVVALIAVGSVLDGRSEPASADDCPIPFYASW